MEQYTNLYVENPLFEGIEQPALLQLLECLKAQKRNYPKGSLIFSAGESCTKLGIVLSGRIHTLYEDVFGGRAIIGTMEPGQLFCDAFCCTKNQRLPVSVMAQVDSEVLLIDIQLILHTCAQACKQHQHLSENLVHVLAEKYVTLNQKLIHLSGRTTRRKLLSYFSEQVKLSNSNSFTIPFNQQELADYLFIERSGLSTEINKLKKEGVLRFEDGLFSLHITPCAGYDCDD